MPEGPPFVFPSSVSYLQTPGNADNRNKKIGHTTGISKFKNVEGTQGRAGERTGKCITLLINLSECFTGLTFSGRSLSILCFKWKEIL